MYTGFVFSSELREKTAWKLPDMIRSNQNCQRKGFHWRVHFQAILAFTSPDLLICHILFSAACFYSLCWKQPAFNFLKTFREQILTSHWAFYLFMTWPLNFLSFLFSGLCHRIKLGCTISNFFHFRDLLTVLLFYQPHKIVLGIFVW
jgi:hypothetical protein